jgi:hypothetical protein
LGVKLNLERDDDDKVGIGAEDNTKTKSFVVKVSSSDALQLALLEIRGEISGLDSKSFKRYAQIVGLNILGLRYD